MALWLARSPATLVLDQSSPAPGKPPLPSTATTPAPLFLSSAPDRGGGSHGTETDTNANGDGMEWMAGQKWGPAMKLV